MKVVVATREFERSGNFQENTFNIKASGKAFRTLSDGMYSDKIKAIIRELSCNAYDAHIEAGTQDKKFDVHLPTNFEPTFYIRDYGTGLSKSDIETIYITYFESTKTNSNNTIGCLGLGSKSPFSYVNMFTITSFFNGMQYVYSALLNEHGTPAIMFLGESETEEHNGLKIQFAVKKEDSREFYYKASDVFFYFNNIPNILGYVPEIKKREYVVINSDWGLSKYREGQAVAIMGNVAYPVRLDSVDFSEQEKAILRGFPVDLFYNIGDLDVTANREGLSYDPRTTKAIRDRVQEILEYEKARVKTDIEKQSCYWDAVVWLKNEKSQNKIVDLLFRHVTLEYKGKNIKEYYDIDKKEYFPEFNQDWDKYKFHISKIYYSDRWSRKLSSYSKVIKNPEVTWRVHIKDKSVFLINDCDNRHKLRIRKLLESNSNIETIYLINNGNKELIDKFKDGVGIIKVGNLSDVELPKVERKKRKESAVGHFVKMNWDAGEISDTVNFWSSLSEEDDFDIEDGGFYIPINRWKTIYKDVEESPRDLLFKLNFLHKKLSPNDPTPVVYGIKKSKVSLVENRDNWISWIDYAQEIIRQYALSPTIKKQLESIGNSRVVNYGNIGRMFRTIPNNESLKNPQYDHKIIGSKFMDSCECDIVKELGERYDLTNDVASVNNSNIINYLMDYIKSGRSNLSEDEINNLDEYSARHDMLMEEFRKKYPLLQDCSSSFAKETGIHDILIYINAINQYNAKTLNRRN